MPGKRYFAETIERLRPVVLSVRPARNEATYQDRLARAFKKAGIEFEREVPCGKGGKVDFEIRRVIVEVKTNGTAIEAARQAVRYATERPDIVGVVIIHTRGETPRLETIGTVPVVFLNVSFSAL